MKSAEIKAFLVVAVMGWLQAVGVAVAASQDTDTMIDYLLRPTE